MMWLGLVLVFLGGTVFGVFVMACAAALGHDALTRENNALRTRLDRVRRVARNANHLSAVSVLATVSVMLDDTEDES